MANNTATFAGDLQMQYQDSWQPVKYLTLLRISGTKVAMLLGCAHQKPWCMADGRLCASVLIYSAGV
jgi:hypothetical protein